MIEFDNVSFRYTPEQPLLEGVSFAVPLGAKVAIVGPSGCGCGRTGATRPVGGRARSEG